MKSTDASEDHIATESVRMSLHRRRQARVLVPVGILLVIMTGLVVYSPTLYQIFCNVTGYGGTIRRAVAKEIDKPANDEIVTIAFDANVAADLPWEFRPEQRKIETRFGEPTKVYYFAKNLSDETIVGRATFNVTPYTTAPFFFKIECFCFTNEKLEPGETARMPLVLYVDEEMLRDPDAKSFRNITLSYTFFRQKDLESDDLNVRDLKGGSEAADARLSNRKPEEFNNDAPRR